MTTGATFPVTSVFSSSPRQTTTLRSSHIPADQHGKVMELYNQMQELQGRMDVVSQRMDGTPSAIPVPSSSVPSSSDGLTEDQRVRSELLRYSSNSSRLDRLEVGIREFRERTAEINARNDTTARAIALHREVVQEIDERIAVLEEGTRVHGKEISSLSRNVERVAINQKITSIVLLLLAISIVSVLVLRYRYNLIT